MRRRDFIAGLGGAAVAARSAWPVAARAQQAAMPVIGVLGSGSRSTFEFALAAFIQGLRQQGYVEDRNVSIQYSWAEGHYDLLPSMASESVRRHVAVIVTFQGTVTAEAAKAATPTIPIVFQIGTDPIAVSLVAALNRPRGNLTGATDFGVELAPKRLDLLRDLVPSITAFGVLINPTNRGSLDILKLLETAAAGVGMPVHVVHVSGESDFDSAFEALTSVGAGALLVGSDPFHVSRRERIVSLTARHRIPTLYSQSEYVKAGGLMSYGPRSTDTFLIVGDYAGRILKGANPADLPVVQPTKVELTINLTTAKALGLTIPETLLATADEVIQ
jgi:putative tryptophan/tyrosine transport system substrate-binding protein